MLIELKISDDKGSTELAWEVTKEVLEQHSNPDLKTILQGIVWALAQEAVNNVLKGETGIYKKTFKGGV